jgi:hypothetical protein
MQASPRPQSRPSSSQSVPQASTAVTSGAAPSRTSSPPLSAPPQRKKRLLFNQSSSDDELSDDKPLARKVPDSQAAQASTSKAAVSTSQSPHKKHRKSKKVSDIAVTPARSGTGERYKVTRPSGRPTEGNPCVIEFLFSDANSDRWPRGESREVNNGRLNYHTPFEHDSPKNKQWRQLLGQYLARDLELADCKSYLLCSPTICSLNLSPAAHDHWILADFPPGYRLFDHHSGPVGKFRNDTYLFGTALITILCRECGSNRQTMPKAASMWPSSAL